MAKKKNISAEEIQKNKKKLIKSAGKWLTSIISLDDDSKEEFLNSLIKYKYDFSQKGIGSEWAKLEKIGFLQEFSTYGIVLKGRAVAMGMKKGDSINFKTGEVTYAGKLELTYDYESVKNQYKLTGAQAEQTKEIFETNNLPASTVNYSVTFKTSVLANILLSKKEDVVSYNPLSSPNPWVNKSILNQINRVVRGRSLNQETFDAIIHVLKQSCYPDVVFSGNQVQEVKQVEFNPDEASVNITQRRIKDEA